MPGMVVNVSREFPGLSACCVWHLDHYELFCSETNRDNFMLIGSDGDLALCIQGSQLLVIHNGWVAESVCLLTANHQVRGIWRQNSLLMLVRHQVRKNSLLMLVRHQVRQNSLLMLVRHQVRQNSLLMLVRQNSLLMLVRHQVRQNIVSFSLDCRQDVRARTGQL
uniref:Uncharacterized protein n=1 Tax=Timema cristinae TaxID=61476 RepID=A0A7R9D507_TIMCR|nr:unnamed protein product [Timema cristinae]